MPSDYRRRRENPIAVINHVVPCIDQKLMDDLCKGAEWQLLILIQRLCLPLPFLARI